MVSPWQEEEILRDLLDGLNAAIDEEGWDYAEVDPIKFNKLLFLAVDYFDLPITYRWYKYGSDFTPHGRSIEEDLQPRALRELASPDEPRIAADDVEEEVTPPSPRQVCTFYREEVEEIERLFEDDTKEYLRRFYEDYAPLHLEEVYSTCAVLQKSLDEIGRGENPAQQITADADTILDELNDLNYAVMFCEDIADADEPFSDYCDLLKDVIVTVEDSNEEISHWQEETLRSVIAFFYDRAWELVALKIASTESQGEQSLEWKRTAGNRFLRQLDTYDNDLQAIRKRCERAHLISDNLLRLKDPKARPATNDGRPEREKEVHDEWAGVSEPKR